MRWRTRERENKKSKVNSVCSENGNSDSQLRKVAFEWNEMKKKNSTMICLVDCVSPSPYLSISDDYLWMKWCFFLPPWFFSWISMDWISVCFHGDRCSFALPFLLPFLMRVYLFVLISLIIYFINITIVCMVDFCSCSPAYSYMLVFDLHFVRFALLDLCLCICVFTYTIHTSRIPNVMNENNNKTTSKWIDKLNTW